MIELRPYDLYIKLVNTQDGEKEVVAIKNSLAFDESFIADLKEKGVKTYIQQENEE